MNKKDARKIIRQRIAPSIFDFCYITTKAHLKSFCKFKALLEEKHEPLNIIDVGCGYKPFQKLLKNEHVEKYVGIDFDINRSAADLVGSVENIPLENNLFNAVIASEVLEHTLNLERATSEIRRVAKNGALVYISTPFLLGEHGAPYDFHRITRYRYFELFKNDEILFLKETNASLATPSFVSNVMLENISIFKIIPILPQIFYFFNNILALLGEFLVWFIKFFGNIFLGKRKKWFEKIIKMYFYTMPGGFDVIVKIKK